MKRNIVRTITTLVLVIAMAAGMTAGLGRKANAATPVEIEYVAGDDAKINGGSSYKPGPSTKITNVKPTRPNCNFLGWTTTKNSGRVDFKPGDPATVKNGTKLWPVWNAIIAYDAGGGKFSNGSIVMNVGVTLGQATKVSNTYPEKTGYEFLGWSTKKNSDVVEYKRGARITYTKPMTLWPVWDAKCVYLDYTFNEDNDKNDSNYQERKLCKYLSSKVSKLSLSRVKVSDGESFQRAWKNMPNDVSVVMINCHANPFVLAPGMVSIYDLEHDVLAFKNIKVIILLGCNAGHIEHYEYNLQTFDRSKKDKNIAMAFAEKFKCVVYAADGNVEAYTLKCGNGKHPDCWEYFNAKNSWRTIPEGWLAYDGRSGKVERHALNLGRTAETTIGAMLDKYYAKHYSW